MSYYVYILLCSDNSYYTGSTNNLERRLYEHQNGVLTEAYTYCCRPVELVWYEEDPTLDEALGHEHQIKGWSRAKKEALIRGDIDGIHEIVKEERRRREKEKRQKGVVGPSGGPER
jgi:predicted GIY-YIG superfamily endonuclease